MIVELSSAQRRALRARAHGLNPVVSVAQQGLTPTVLAEIERSLAAHELIKIRVYGEERDVRAALMTQICETVSAAPVQHIGNILVIYRELPQEAAPEAKPAKAAAKPARKAAGAKGTKVGARVVAREPTRAPSRSGGKTAAAPRRRAVTGGKTRAGR